MSASEKLKKLQELPAPPFDPELKLYAALPQIVAVVEAAERFWSDDVVDGIVAAAILGSALAALDEALS